MSAVTEGGRIKDFDTSSYLGLLGFNAVTFVLNFLCYPVYILGYAPIMLIGFTWARRGVLADVPAHRKELSFWAVIGVVYILRSEEHTSELQSRFDLVCLLLLEQKNKTTLHSARI